MKTKTAKIPYVKMLKFNIKQDDHVNKKKLNKKFSKEIQVTEDYNGIIVKGSGAVALRWNSSSET